jgi:hypothetical protein
MCWFRQSALKALPKPHLQKRADEFVFHRDGLFDLSHWMFEDHSMLVGEGTQPRLSTHVDAKIGVNPNRHFGIHWPPV